MTEQNAKTKYEDYRRRIESLNRVRTALAAMDHKTMVFRGILSDDAFAIEARALANVIIAEYDKKGHRVNTMKMVFHEIEKIIESEPDRE